MVRYLISKPVSKISFQLFQVIPIFCFQVLNTNNLTSPQACSLKVGNGNDWSQWSPFPNLLSRSPINFLTQFFFLFPGYLPCRSWFMLSKFNCNTLGWKTVPSFMSLHTMTPFNNSGRMLDNFPPKWPSQCFGGYFPLLQNQNLNIFFLVKKVKILSKMCSHLILSKMCSYLYSARIIW